MSSFLSALFYPLFSIRVRLAVGGQGLGPLAYAPVCPGWLLVVSGTRAAGGPMPLSHRAGHVFRPEAAKAGSGTRRRRLFEHHPGSLCRRARRHCGHGARGRGSSTRVGCTVEEKQPAARGIAGRGGGTPLVFTRPRFTPTISPVERKCLGAHISPFSPLLPRSPVCSVCLYKTGLNRPCLPQPSLVCPGGHIP